MYVGVDLGGTKIAAAVVDVERGTLIGQHVVPTEAHEGPPAVLERIIKLVTAVCNGAGVLPDQLQGLGLGVPGVFDAATGHTLLLPNLPSAWINVSVVQPLVAGLGCPVILINDARAFVLGEATWGAGRGAHTIVGVTLGTGIGGGIAINGHLHLGIDGTAGEVGHMTIDPHGLLCGCGNRGCLETLASGPAITSLGIRALIHGNTTSLGKLAGYDPRRVTPELIGQAAAAGDPVARDILARAGDALGIGVANLVTVLSPDRVVLGGGVTHLGPWLFDAVRAVVRERCRAIPVERVAIIPAALGTDAGMIGAAMWAAQQQRNT